MAIPTHIFETIVSNQAYRSFIGPEQDLDTFLTPLSRSDGERVFAHSVSKLPRAGWAEDFSEDELHHATDHFIQAGGSAERMTVEIRQSEPGAGARLFKVGHTTGSTPPGDPATAIHVGANINYVFDTEIFSASEAAELFYHYYRYGILPGDYSLRDMDFA